MRPGYGNYLCGRLHLGHALTVTVEDCIVRQRRLRGQKVGVDDDKRNGNDTLLRVGNDLVYLKRSTKLPYPGRLAAGLRPRRHRDAIRSGARAVAARATHATRRGTRRVCAPLPAVGGEVISCSRRVIYRESKRQQIMG